MRFGLQLPRLVFGPDAVDALAEGLTLLGSQRPLIVTDAVLKRVGHLDRLRAALDGRVACEVFAEVPENPTLAGVDLAAEHYRKHACDGVVALGGGSVIDTAKLVAVLARHAGSAADYVGFSERVTANVAPIVVIPTTAGTGSEASPDAGIHPDAHSISSGISTRFVVPRIAICDPKLTLTLPPTLTAATGLDALSHCVEGLLSKTDNPLADALVKDGLRRVWTNVERATRNGDDLDARGEMMLAAFAGGVAIGKGMGPAHAIAISCGDQGLQHGILSAIGVLASLRKMREVLPEKVFALGRVVGLSDPSRFPEAVADLMGRLDLPCTLADAGYKLVSLDDLSLACSTSHFNATSSYVPTRSEYAEMLSGILG